MKKLAILLLSVLLFAGEVKIIQENLDDQYVSAIDKASFAIMVDKKRFFKYLPSLMNSLNAYYMQKGIDYNITVYDINTSVDEIPYHDIIYLATNPDKLYTLANYPNKRFYIPLINKNEFNVSLNNLYFGSIDFKAQLKKLYSYTVGENKIISVNQHSILSEKLNKDLKEIVPNQITSYYYPSINYDDLNQSYVFFNTSAGKTAQILSTATQKEVSPILEFTTQIDFDPLLIILTQPEDIKKLLIANSIINPPRNIEDYCELLNSNIRYNWLNYAALIFANKIYNMQNGEDRFFMQDFHRYIFENQINYPIKIYKIDKGAFVEVR